jgi:hypothetical protein
MTHDDNDSGPVTFVDMVLVLLEDQFPWLTTESKDAVSGADTVDQLIKLHASLLRQPTTRGKVLAFCVRDADRDSRHDPECCKD